MAVFEPERCYSCKKLFCCVDCCVNHIKSKHPGRELECPLCRNEPLRTRNFENKQFFCHVLFHHLPLYCRTCGDLFENAEDLKAIGNNCGRHPLIKIEPPTFIELTKSLSSIKTPSPLNRIPYQPLSVSQKGIIIGSDNSDFSNLTSPPELIRSTSTPMHISFMRKNYNSHDKLIPKIPNIILTTPSFSIRNNSVKSDISLITSNSNLNETESIYHSLRSSLKSNLSNNTSLKSILSMKSELSEIEQEQDYLKNISDKKLASMEELDENEVDMDLTDSHGVIYTGNNTPPTDENHILNHHASKDSGKKVRFIDEIDIKKIFDNKSDVSEMEEFFEAHQSPCKMSRNEDLNMNNPSITVLNTENFNNFENEVIDNNDEDEKNKREIKNCESAKNSDSKSESASRIVMMVLVEQTGDDQLTDLSPLIDSSLKKLKSILAKSSSGQNKTSSVNEEKSMGKLSIVSVDSYTSVSTVECFKAPNVKLIPQNNRSITPSFGLSGNTIFSAVANAVKNVFRNLSGVTTTKSPTTEATSSEESSSLTPSSRAKKKSSSITNGTEKITSRPSKRSRENDLISGDLSEESNSKGDSLDSQNEIRSPSQKRPREWYRQIHGREPIARMKNLLLSPRGISSERQCFQMGSLTVGDTVLPLPSRAYYLPQND